MTNRPVSGGGPNSRVVKSVGVRAGPPSTNKVNPAGVSQLGYATAGRLTREGGHTSKNDAQKVFQGTAPQVPSGNAAAAETVAGPGGSRTVMRSGSQGTHGPVVPDRTPDPGDWFVQNYPGVPTAKGR
jgi:hypothetical protein